MMLEDGEQAYVYTVPADFSEGLSCVSDGEKFGYINTKGERVIPFVYDEAEPFSEGSAKVRLDGTDAYIDARGDVVFRFSEIERDSGPEELLLYGDGLICVIRGGKLGYVDVNGKTVVPFIYDNVWDTGYPGLLCEGLICVSRNGRFGYVDEVGREVVPTELDFDQAFGFSGGYVSVFANGKWGLIDKRGKTVLPPVFEKSVRMFFDGALMAGVTENETLLFDADFHETARLPKGNGVFPCGGYIGVFTNGSTLVFDRQGREVTRIPGSVAPSGGGIAHVAENGKWGVVSLPYGEIIAEPEYDSITLFDEEGFAVAVRGGETYIMHIG